MITEIKFTIILELGYLCQKHENMIGNLIGPMTVFWKMWTPKKVYYDGNWLDDKRHGQGKMFYGDKSIYDGEWEQDLEMGFGRLYMPNGDMYQGHWKDGKRHGQGEYHFQSRGQVLKVS